MTVRTLSLLATVTLFASAAEHRLAAQPVVPNRPRSSAFQSLFYPGSQAVPNAGLGPGYGPQLMNRGQGAMPGTVLPGQQLSLTGPVTPTPTTLPGVGQPVVFNNLGHWYSGYYGHWYPDGIASGLGVLRGGGSFGVSPLRGGPLMTGGPMLTAGTGLGVGVGVPLGSTGPRIGTPGRR
jgi:hypothetical protein